MTLGGELKERSWSDSRATWEDLRLCQDNVGRGRCAPRLHDFPLPSRTSLGALTFPRRLNADETVRGHRSPCVDWNRENWRREYVAGRDGGMSGGWMDGKRGGLPLLDVCLRERESVPPHQMHREDRAGCHHCRPGAVCVAGRGGETTAPLA